MKCGVEKGEEEGGCMDGWDDGWMAGWMLFGKGTRVGRGQRNGWMEGRMDG